jgi:hypothetical protein
MMDKKTYCMVTLALFLIIALLHLVRIFTGFEVSLGGWLMPEWVSWAGLVIAGFLAYSGFVLWRREA